MDIRNSDSPIIEVTPTSPPSEFENRLDCGSPEIRVTDTPEPECGHPSSPVSSPQSLHQPMSPPTSIHGSPISHHGSPTSISSPLSSPTFTTTPPILFQPFLPLPQFHHRKVLPFSIDNILRPTFGRALLPTSLMSPSSICSEPSTPIKEEPKSPPPILVNNHSSSSSSSSKPVDLSKTNFNNNNNNSESNEPKKEADDDCPPGMVRGPNGQLWPAWVFCTRYSDRPSSGPRSRRIKPKEKSFTDKNEKRPRTAFSSDQLARLKREFEENRYLTEERRKNLATELGLHDNQIKIWFQNKRAKLKKGSGQKGELAQMLAAQGLYNHTTVPVDEDDNPLY